MTTKRMSEERLETLKRAYSVDSSTPGALQVNELLAEIDALRAELTAARTVGLENYNRACRERDEARAALAKAREALERIANHPNANALILTGKPMIGVGTLARDVLATPTQESETP